MLQSYFIAGLKPPRLGAKTPLSVDSFMDRARDTLTGALLLDLELLNLSRQQMHWDQMARRQFYKDMIANARTVFLAEFAKGVVDVYEVLAAMLAKRAGLTHAHYQNEHLGRFESTALMIHKHYDELHFGLLNRHRFIKTFEESLAKNDPHSLEQAIAEHLIALAESIAQGGDFSSDAVLSYFIKLDICERFQSFDEERGKAILSNLINSIKGALA